MKKRFGVSIVLILILVLAISVYAARLPAVNGDNNGWGTVLNDFLDVAHDSGGNIETSYITSAMIVDGAIVAADLAASSVNTTHILDATIGALDFATSVVNGTIISDDSVASVDIQNATIIAIDIASGAINTTHILDNTILGVDIANATIEAIDIISSAINTTHILDATILGSDIANSAGLNISTVIVSINKTRSPETNITGIYVNSSYIDLPSMVGGTCMLVHINMTGLPGGVACFAFADPTFEDVSVGNITIVGVNSTQNNCRLRVCNVGGLAAINPPNSLYGAMAIAIT